MNGRIYDPLLGRMLLPDVLIPRPGSLQGYNRYTYVLNNPLSLTDPSGWQPAGEVSESIPPDLEFKITEHYRQEMGDALIRNDTEGYDRAKERLRSAEQSFRGLDINNPEPVEEYSEIRDADKPMTAQEHADFESRAAAFKAQTLKQPVKTKAEEIKPSQKDSSGAIQEKLPIVEFKLPGSPSTSQEVKDTDPDSGFAQRIFYRGAKPGEEISFSPGAKDFKTDANSFVKTSHGVSVFDNPESVSSKGRDPFEIVNESVPDTLKFIQRGQDPSHFEIVPAREATLKPEEFAAELEKIKVKL